MKTLKGKDHETKANIAYNLIIAKIQSSDSRGKWNYLVKNMIILDRMIEQKIFVHQVSELELDNVENFKDLKSKNNIMNIIIIL